MNEDLFTFGFFLRSSGNRLHPVAPSFFVSSSVMISVAFKVLKRFTSTENAFKIRLIFGSGNTAIFTAKKRNQNVMIRNPPTLPRQQLLRLLQWQVLAVVAS